jgi:hypothetical protein
MHFAEVSDNALAAGIFGEWGLDYGRPSGGRSGPQAGRPRIWTLAQFSRGIAPSGRGRRPAVPESGRANAAQVLLRGWACD